jgi:hypothetical protein
VDESLSLSKIFGISMNQRGVSVICHVLCILWQLIDAVSDEEGLLELTPEKKGQWPTRADDMSAFEGAFTEQRSERRGIV